MSQRSNSVVPEKRRLTDSDVRRLMAPAILFSALQHGPERLGLEIGCNEKTVRRARDGETMLGFGCTLNLLDVDPHAMDAVMAAKGFMLLPLAPTATDVIPAAGAAIHRIGQNRCEHSPGGTTETDDELIASEAESDALLAAAIERRAAIARAKLRRADRAA